MSRVYRIYVKKQKEYAVEAYELLENLKSQLKIEGLEDIEVINRYDIEGVSEENLKKAIPTILSEPMVDEVYEEEYPYGDKAFAIEYLPGQYDQRADATKQCFEILGQSGDIKVKFARIINPFGNLSDEDIEKIEHYMINPVDQRLAGLDKYTSLKEEKIEIKEVPTLEAFIDLSDEGLHDLLDKMSLAMNFDDLKLTQDYFKNDAKRNPTETEIRVLDTYWSDHCRHTTFATIIDDIAIEDDEFKDVYKKDIEEYLNSRKLVYGINTNRPITLMDLATISMKELRKEGYLDDMEVSDEINACSVEVDVNTSEGVEKWLLMFKNETHNHPTEIEPFGGAATCLGGAIRDPLSGRAYVYQSMRISGAGDPRLPFEETLKGKLPQRKICKEAAHGFSSYGNQIGLTTGYVHEIYDEGYIAKRMELGAVVAAAPKSQVKRLQPLNGHVVLLIGGRTGRDGIGGATGSSKTHSEKTTSTAGAEVQKGNPVEERKIQRLFRNPAVSEKIVRCNDFGAGGVSVAVGELADSLDINLDAILKKYDGLNGTELAISESQERMAIVIDPKDKEFIINECHNENLEVVEVATVTDDGHLRMHYLGQTVVDIKRDFLNENGASRHQTVSIKGPDFKEDPFVVSKEKDFKKASEEILSSLSVCSQKGLVECFDSSIGNATILSPYGGKYFRTETEAMAALLPVLGKETTTCSIMAYGYDPKVAKWSPYHGAIYAVIESLSKIVAAGGDYHTVRFSFQEFFEKLFTDAKRWGKPFAALLGAYRAQSELKLASIGGKDSMSGSFENLDVPPTFVSFAITKGEVQDIITPELKEANHKLLLLSPEVDDRHLPDFASLTKMYDEIINLNKDKKIYSAYTVKAGGILEALYKMAFGNMIGVELNDDLDISALTYKNYGSIIIEVDEDVETDYPSITLGHSKSDNTISYRNNEMPLEDAYHIYEMPLESIYPSKIKSNKMKVNDKTCEQRPKLHASKVYDEVKVVIPVFPGTNCEYDSKRAFEKAGAKVELVLIRNKTNDDIAKSIDELAKAISTAQIVMLPGGFSAGDEPEGSGKFIATFLRNEKLKEAIDDLLDNREGLMIGICNGFQALIKLGLLPDGHIKQMSKDDATLTFNTINRHLSQMVRTRITSVKSPWLANVNVNDIHTIPISHGEGRFVAPDELIEELFDNGQVITQYVDMDGAVTMDSPYNPNGSMMAIEGIVSKDGRILGKMGHSERVGENRYKNVYGEMDQKLFEAGVNYFK